MSGIELMVLRMSRRLREEYDEAYAAELKRLQDPNQPKKVPMTQTPAPKPRSNKSPVVLAAIWLFVLALGGGIAALFTPIVAPLAIIVGLMAVGVCVLSLREDL